MDSSLQEGFQPIPDTEQEYKKQIKELEQQVRLLKEQADFLTRKPVSYTHLLLSICGHSLKKKDSLEADMCKAFLFHISASKESFFFNE